MNHWLKFLLTALLSAIVLTGAFLWLRPLHRPDASTPVAARQASAPVATPRSSAASPAAQAPAAPAENIADVTSEMPEQTLPGPVLPQPKPIALAAVAETPAAPETGPSLPPATVLENMRSVFRQYCARLGGNPIGNNAEITAALNGANPRLVVFLNPEDGTRINHRGELVDNWGTPFFFHQISRIEMEIHSAGPDRKMWTADDLVIK